MKRSVLRAGAIVAAIVVVLVVMVWRATDRATGPAAPERDPAARVEADSTTDRAGDAPPLRRRVRPADASNVASSENTLEPPATPATESPPLDPEQSFEVRVIDADDDSPVPGAVIYNREKVPDAEKEWISINADERGVARVPWPLDGTQMIEAIAAGYSPSGWNWVKERPKAPEVRTLRLHRPVTFAVRVVDVTNSSPVEGVAVEVRSGSEVSSTELTLPDGTCVLHGVAPRKMARLGFSVGGYAPIEVLVNVGPGGEPPVQIELTPAATLVGRVVTATGDPASGATVRVVSTPPRRQRQPGGGGTIFEVRWPELEASTDANGRFRVPGLTLDRTYVASAWSPGTRASPPSDELRPLSLPTEIELVLPASGSIVVVVTDGDESAPSTTHVELGDVGAPGFLGEPWYTGRSADRGDDGRFRLADVLPGVYRLRITAEGRVPAEIEAVVDGGEPTELAVDLVRGSGVSGVVVDDLGEPVADVEVGGWQGEESLSTRTDAQGRFRFERFSAGALLVGVSSKSHRSEAVEATAPTTDLRVTALRMATLVLRIRVPDGVEIPYVYADMETFRGEGEPDPFSRGQEWWGDGERARFDGRVAEVRFHTVGPSRIVVKAEGFAYAIRYGDPPPGTIVDLGEVTLSPGRSLVGRVLDDRGEPIAGARVRSLEGPTWEQATQKTDAEGAFRIEHLADGPVTVRVSAVVHSRWEGTIDVGDNTGPVVVTLTRKAPIVVQLIDADGAPVSGHRVVCGPAGVGESGNRYRLMELRARELPGHYVVFVEPGLWTIRAEGDPSGGVDVEATLDDLNPSPTVIRVR